MTIPEKTIDEIRNALDIVDVINQYVRLRKRGKNYIGLCPFHQEKTPSFTVSGDKQIFHCFGCHAGGNVFKFLMDYKKVSYVEALEEGAAIAGIVIRRDENKVSNKNISETEQLFDINYEVAKFYSDTLLSKPDGEFARKYFENRNIKINSMRGFGLGYSPSDDSLIRFLKDKSINFDQAIKLGIIGKSAKGNFYDRFYGRIIFPLFSPNGRVIGFAGRVLESNSNSAKYINSPESKIYLKGNTLYGLSFAKDEIRKKDQAVIVEGYLDLISLYQNGIKNVVAVSGTAFTEEQAVLLSRYTKNSVLTFDADNAGIKATRRSIEVLLKKEFNIKIISLPKNEDPDSFVRNYGPSEFIKMIDSAVNFLEFYASVFKANGDFSEPVKQANAIKLLVSLIALIKDELTKSLMIKSLSEKYNIRESLLENEADKLIKKNATYSSPVTDSVQTSWKNNREAISESYSLNISKETNIHGLELIKFLLEGKKKVSKYIFQNISEEEIADRIVRRIFVLLKDFFEKNQTTAISLFLDEVDDSELAKFLVELTLEQHKISDRWESFKKSSKEEEIELLNGAIDCISLIKLNTIEKEHQVLVQRLKQVSENDEIFEIMNEIDYLAKKKKEITDSRKTIN